MKQEKQGGGIGIIVKDEIECKRIKSTKTISFEHGIWKITTGGKSFALAVIYRSPSLGGITINNFTNELITTLTDIMAHEKDIILLGDFNIRINVVHQQDRLLSCQLHPTFPPGYKEYGAIRLQAGIIR